MVWVAYFYEENDPVIGFHQEIFLDFFFHSNRVFVSKQFFIPLRME